MIAIHPISPENELRVAERLRDSIVRAWPGIDTNTGDRIELLVGVRTPTDVDLLVLVRLAEPRIIPPQKRRRALPSLAATVQTALIAIELKALDLSQFDRLGNQLFPIYHGHVEKRSVAKQACDSAFGVSGIARNAGTHPYVHGLAWLTEVDDDALLDIEPIVLGAEADWYAILDAAMRQRPFVTAEADVIATARAAEIVGRTLLNRRIETKRDRARVECLSRDLAARAAVDALVPRVGTAQIRLIGRGGSGKTTSLALMAISLAETGARVLILTFHLTLRSDIAHLIASMSARSGIPPDRIAVQTTASFLLGALADLGVDAPMRDGVIDYSTLDALLDETRGQLIETHDGIPGDAEHLRAMYPKRFGWDHIFIDESQDCTDSERDFLRALYGHRRLVLADGVDQLQRRQIACDWMRDIPKNEIIEHRLDKSLRMLRNVATFVNAFARALDLPTWRIEPQADLPGGRIIIAVGDAISGDLLRAIVASAAQQKADAADCLICVPPKINGDDRVRLSLLAAGADAGIALWDGTDPAQRTIATAGTGALRLVRYESCRGLEGWVTVALDLDVFARNRQAHPNLGPNEPSLDASFVANRAMLIPLTRAVHTLVITVRDPASDVAMRLRAAMDDPAMPRDAIAWVDASELERVLAPVASSSRS